MSFLIGEGHVRVTLNTAGVVAKLGAITSAAGVAGAALGALPALAGSVAGIGGVVAGAFSGVGDALKGYQSDQKAATKAGGQAASAAKAQARQIRDAQQSVDDARRSAAKVARDASERIQEAQRDEARVARDTAEAVADAKERQSDVVQQGAEKIEDAADRVADALKDEQRAQEDLTQAREDAARQLDDLREKVSDYALDQEGAAIRVARAEERLAEVQGDPAASALDLRDAIHDLNTARERQSDLTREQTEDTAKLAEAERLGIDGSDKVVEAKQKVADAEEKVSDARREQARTAREVAEANAEAAERVAEVVRDGAEKQQQAARAVADAQRDGAEAQEAANRQVADALRGLADAQDTANQSVSSGAAATSAYADAMAKLNPQQRELVKQLISMAPLVDRLKAASSETFLPGLVSMLRDSEGLFPIFEGHLRNTGTIMGDTARKAGDLFKTDTFKSNLQAMLDASLPITQSLSDGALKVINSWVRLGSESGPAAQGFASGLDRLFAGLDGMFLNLEPHMDSFGKLLDGVIGGLGDMLPGVGTALGVIADALVVMGPWLPPIVVGFLALIGAVKVVQALGTAWAILSAIFAASPIGLVIIGIVALVAALVTAYATSETFRNIVDAAFRAVGAAGTWLWQNALKPAFDAIMIGLRAVGDFVVWVWQNVIKPNWDALGIGVRWVVDNVLIPAWNVLRAGLQGVGDFFGWIWNSVIKPAWDALGAGIRWVVDNMLTPAWNALKAGLQGISDAFTRTVDWVRTKWDEIREAARRPVQWVVDVVYNNGIRPVWNGIASIFGLGQLAPVHLAGGGVLPGYSPGRDTVPAMLSPGEAVLVPELVRQIGPANIMAANRAASGRKAASGGRFAGGGIIGAIGSFATDLFSKGPVAAVQGAFRSVTDTINQTPGAGLIRDALIRLPGKVIDAVITKAKSWIASAAASVFGGGGSAPASRAGNVAAVRAVAGGYGWGGGPQWDALYRLIMKESGFNNVAQNPTSTAFGMFQFLNGTWGGYGVPKTSDPRLQAVAGLRYISSRYGSPAGALAFHNRNNWYDEGGILPSGMVGFNGSGRPERVLSPQQTQAFDQLVAALDRNGGRGSGDVNIYMQQPPGSPAEAGRYVALALRTVG